MTLKNNINFNSFTYESIYRLTAVFPIALSMAVCSGMGISAGIIGAAIACVMAATQNTKHLMPVFLSYSVAEYTFSQYGFSTLATSVAICGVFLIVSAFLGFDIKKLIFQPAVTALMISTAINITVLETTNYFGIGATGSTVGEMLKSYGSLGFHANWRGVLYGTIVLVVMITFPRKFKKLEKVLSASFVALFITVILNLFLNPDKSTTAINEVGSIDFDILQTLFPTFKELPNISAALFTGLALYITTAYSIADTKSSGNLDFAITGAANCCCSAFSGVFLPYKSQTHKNFSFAGIPAMAVIVLAAIFLKDFIERIPLHSCAVILIVGAWQSVKWRQLKYVFKDVTSMSCFLAVLSFMLFFGALRGVVFGAICSLLGSQFTRHVKEK